MGEETKPESPFSEAFTQWAKAVQATAEVAGQFGEAWSTSMLPFVLTRAAEGRASGAGNEMGEAIERMAQGPRLADIWDTDRKFATVFTAWTKMRQKLLAYNAVASRPWLKAAELYGKEVADKESGEFTGDWRRAFSAWSSLANSELVQNQRSEEFLGKQRELLRAAIEFRKAQTELSKTIGDFLGIPTQSDFDDVTRQLTELRREVRALEAKVAATGAATGANTAADSAPRRMGRKPAPAKGAST